MPQTTTPSAMLDTLSHDQIFAMYERLGIKPISGGSGAADPPANPAPNPPAGDPPAPTPTSSPTPEEDDPADPAIGEAGRAAIKRERDARKEADAELKRLQAEIDRRDADARRAEDDAAAKRGEFEKLANDRQAEIDRLTNEAKQRDAADLRRKVAAKHKLPDQLADRLRGDDEAALEADAKELAKLIPAEPKPGNGPNPPPAGPVGDKELTESKQDQQQRIAKRF